MKIGDRVMSVVQPELGVMTVRHIHQNGLVQCCRKDVDDCEIFVSDMVRITDALMEGKRVHEMTPLEYRKWRARRTHLPNQNPCAEIPLGNYQEGVAMVRHKEVFENIDPGSMDGWKQTALMHHKNEQYYRGLLERIGVMIGPEAYESDDGSMQQDAICCKIPDLVARLIEHAGYINRDDVTSVAAMEIRRREFEQAAVALNVPGQRKTAFPQLFGDSGLGKALTEAKDGKLVAMNGFGFVIHEDTVVKVTPAKLRELAACADPNFAFQATPDQYRELAFDLERAADGRIKFMDDKTETTFVLESRA